ncbi:hypothetical protein ACFQ07_28605, partial [Actinomadura adrarensis]
MIRPSIFANAITVSETFGASRSIASEIGSRMPLMLFTPSADFAQFRKSFWTRFAARPTPSMYAVTVGWITFRSSSAKGRIPRAAAFDPAVAASSMTFFSGDSASLAAVPSANNLVSDAA